MSEDHRVAQHRQQHRRSKRYPGRPHGNRREQCQRLVPGPGDNGIADPDRIEPQCLRLRRKVEQRHGLRNAVHDVFAGGQHITDFGRHGWLSHCAGQRHLSVPDIGPVSTALKKKTGIQVGLTFPPPPASGRDIAAARPPLVLCGWRSVICRFPRHCDSRARCGRLR